MAAKRTAPRRPAARRSDYKFRTLDPDARLADVARSGVLAAYADWYVADVELARLTATEQAVPAKLRPAIAALREAAAADADGKARRLNRKERFAGKLTKAERDAAAREFLAGWLAGVLEPTYAAHLHARDERAAALAVTGADAPTAEEAAALQVRLDNDELAIASIRVSLELATARLDALPAVAG